MMLTGWWKCLGFSSPQQSPLESLLRLLLSRKPPYPTATSYLTHSVLCFSMKSFVNAMGTFVVFVVYLFLIWGFIYLVFVFFTFWNYRMGFLKMYLLCLLILGFLKTNDTIHTKMCSCVTVYAVSIVCVLPHALRISLSLALDLDCWNDIFSHLGIRSFHILENGAVDSSLNPM